MTITVIVSEETSPFPPAAPWPLIFDLEFDHWFERGDGLSAVSEEYQDEILQRVAEERYDEIGADMFDLPDRDLLSVESIKSGLKLHFALVGPAEVAMDWREA